MAKKESDVAEINVEPYKKDAVSLSAVAEKLIVNSEESESESAELISRVEAKRKEIKGTHDSLTKPLKDHVKFINRMFDPIEDKLEEISASLRRKNVEYFKIKEAKAEEKRLKEMEKFEKKAEKAIASGKEMPDFNSRVVEPEKTVVTTSGTLSMQKIMNFEVLDVAHVPRQYLVVDESLIRKAVAEGAREIAGVRIFEDVRSVNRR
jgi:DNA repair exonuclease SbcCD ATPase subunit